MRCSTEITSHQGTASRGGTAGAGALAALAAVGAPLLAVALPPLAAPLLAVLAGSMAWRAWGRRRREALQLPVTPPSEPDPVPVVAVPPAADWRVLAVDGSPASLRVVRQHLVGNGIQVTACKGAAEVLARLDAEGPFDLLLVDVHVPDNGGYEVCRRVRERYSPGELPVVLVTARGDQRQLLDGFAAGASDYLCHPFSRAELLVRVRTHIELARTHRAYRRFVPREFLRLLGKERIADVVRGDQVQRRMSVLFADIRGFTALSEHMTPRENFNFINSFLGRMGPIIREHGGFIDKYLGDGLMAIFPEQPADAVRAAVGMNRELYRYNTHRARSGYTPIRIGVGIHHGNLMLGTVGEQERMDGTVISSDVNLAARLENLTKSFGVAVVASEDVLGSPQERQALEVRRLGRVRLKGRHLPVTVFDVFEGEALEIRSRRRLTRARFEEAVDLFAAGLPEQAMREFREVLKSDPEDPAAAFYAHRARRLLLAGVPAAWDGHLTVGEEEPGIPAWTRREA